MSGHAAEAVISADSGIQRVVCVTVTYAERRALLRQVLDALVAQGVARTVVVDNGARWPVKDELTAAYGNFVEVVEMGRNTGSAGGFAAGIRRAVELQADFIWLLDDDNRPVPGCLATLLNVYNELLGNQPTGLLAVLAFRPHHQADLAAGVPVHRINPRPNSFRGFHVLDIPYKVWRRTRRGRPSCGAALPTCVDLLVAPYSGLLFHRTLVEVVGVPYEKLVLYADDYEYTSRITQRGGRIVLVTAGCLEELEHSWNNRRNSSSSFEVLLKQGSDLRAYYTMRNGTYVDVLLFRKNRWVFFVNRVVYATLLWMFAVLYKKRARCRVLFAAMNDGLAARLGMNECFPLDPVR